MEDIDCIKKYLKPNSYEEYKEGLDWFTEKLGKAVVDVFNQFVAEVKYTQNI